MKNLKKVLALVLVVVMALGLITVSNAATFTDAQSITKAEAVDVLSAVGVINGYPDGSFKPEGEVTRAEMAKMVATILNKGDDVGDLYKNACKFADAANHWAAGYIAYCAQAGIINGKSETVFDPDGKVTGTEAAKMLLCALGYKADAEGFVGANWASAVLARAAEAHLVGKTYNLTANMAEPLNRENTAQMMLNALKADMVKYKNSGTTITIGDAKINTGSEFEKKTDDTGATAPAAAYQYKHIGNEQNNAAGVYTVQLGEEMFDTLELTAAAANDVFGRPAAAWSYEGKEVSRAPQAADFEYTDKVKGGDVYAALGKVKIANGVLAAADEYTAKLYVNGTLVYDGTVPTAANAEIAKITSANKNEIGAIGDKIEIYKDANNKLITFVAQKYYITTISNVVAPKTNAAGDIEKVGYVTLSAPIVAMASPEVTEGAAIPANSFETTAFTSADVGAYVIYTYSTQGTTFTGGIGNTLQSVVKADSVTGLFSTYVAGDGCAYESVVIGGTSYKADASVVAMALNTDVTAYLDPNGNVAYLDGVASKDFVYLIDNFTKNGDFGTTTELARLVFTDGTVKEVETEVNYAADQLYTYTTNAKGVYTLTAVPAASAVPKAAVAKNNTDFNGGNNKLNYFAGVKVNNDTLFIVETYDTTNKVALYATYTGVNNLPTIASANYANATWGTYAPATAKAGGAVTSVTPNGDTYATVVYVFGTTVQSTSSQVTALYMTAKDPLTKDADGNSYYTSKAIVGGAETSVKIDAPQHAAGLVVADSITMNGDIITGYNNVVLDNPTYNKEYAGFVYNAVDQVYDGTYSAGNIELTGPDAEYNLDASIPVYAYNADLGTFSITTIGAYAPTGAPAGTDQVVVTLTNAVTPVPTAFYIYETNS